MKVFTIPDIHLKPIILEKASEIINKGNFDRIIMLENGKIAEEGTYSELMAKDGHFAQLVRKQLLQSTKKSFIS